MRAQPVIGFPLDFPTFIVSHLLPHLNPNAAYRIRNAEGPDCFPSSDPQARSGPFGSRSQICRTIAAPASRSMLSRLLARQTVGDYTVRTYARVRI